MEGLKIIALCVFGAIVYGILHDVVTAHLCLPYFTVFHPDLFHTASPWLLALGWGVVATWWVGLLLGLLVMAAARQGRLPKLGWRELVRPLLVVLGGSYVCAALAGFIAYAYYPTVPAVLSERMPVLGGLNPSEQHWFMVDLFAHNTSYAACAVGAAILCAYVIRRRVIEHP